MDSGNMGHFLDFWPFRYARARVDRSLVFFGRDLPGRILATVSGERYRHGSRIATGVERHDRIDSCPGCIYVLHGISSCQHKIARTCTDRHAWRGKPWTMDPREDMGTDRTFPGSQSNRPRGTFPRLSRNQLTPEPTLHPSARSLDL